MVTAEKATQYSVWRNSDSGVFLISKIPIQNSNLKVGTHGSQDQVLESSLSYCEVTTLFQPNLLLRLIFLSVLGWDGGGWVGGNCRKKNLKSWG